eukprot:806415-Amphidinium_carterae.1
MNGPYYNQAGRKLPSLRPPSSRRRPPWPPSAHPCSKGGATRVPLHWVKSSIGGGLALPREEPFEVPRRGDPPGSPRRAPSERPVLPVRALLGRLPGRRHPSVPTLGRA